MRARLLTGGVVLGLASAALARGPHGSVGFDGPIALVAAKTAARYGLITSTIRSIEHNRAVGGVPDSYHLSGQAIDVVRKPGVTHAQLAAALRAAGYRLIESLDEGTHSHFAFAVGAPGAPGAVVPPKPQIVLKDLLGADQHGTLLLDLEQPAQARPSERSGLRSAR